MERAARILCGRLREYDDALSVGRHVEVLQDAGSENRGARPDAWRGDAERRALNGVTRSHDAVIIAKEQQFMCGRRPGWKFAACRYLPFPPGPRKRPHKERSRARFIRGVGDEFPVG